MEKNSNTDISLVFFTRMNFRSPEVGHQLLNLLFKHGRDFFPEQFDDNGKWRPITPPNFNDCLHTWNRSHNMLLRRTKRFRSEIGISMGYAATGRFNTLNIWVMEEYFRKQSRLAGFLKLATALYDLISPVYGYIHQTQDAISMKTVQDPRFGNTIVPTNLTKGLPGIYWANFLGKEYVELIGKQRLVSLPCNISPLNNGGYLIITSDSPLIIEREKQLKIKKQIGDEFFYHWGKTGSIKVPGFG